MLSRKDLKDLANGLLAIGSFLLIGLNIYAAFEYSFKIGILVTGVIMLGLAVIIYTVLGDSDG